jgi:hypothetical protein
MFVHTMHKLIHKFTDDGDNCGKLDLNYPYF